MIDLTWRIEDEVGDEELTGTPRPLLGTWHYLRSALRCDRRWWVLAALLGAVLGVSTVFLLPPNSKASTTMLMVHPTNFDGESAMATDLSLLGTREVATRTVRALGLDEPPEAFQGSVSAEPVTTVVLRVNVSAPDDESAVRRVNALTREYLDFRAAELRSLSSGTISGYKSRITTMQEQVSAITRDYSIVAARGEAGQDQAIELLARRSQLSSQIVDMQRAVEDASLTSESAISSTHVLDAATLQPRSEKRALVLNGGSGLIAGTALGVALVLFRALTSTRVRRRQDVSLALRTPVRLSVRSRGRPERRFPLGGLKSLHRAWHGQDLAAMAQTLAGALSAPGHAARQTRKVREGGGRRRGAPERARPISRDGLALAAMGNSAAAADILGATADLMREDGRSVLLVDLSPSGALQKWAGGGGGVRRRTPRGGAEPHDVVRPPGALELATAPRTDDESDVGQLAERWAAADVVLVLAGVDPGVDAESLASWVGQVVPLVTAGESTPELLETTAELVRAAGLGLPFALMVGADPHDESLGRSAQGPAVAATVSGRP